MGLNYPKDQGTEWFNLKQQVKSAFTSANSRVPYQKIAAGILKVATSLEVLAGAMFTFRYSDNSVGMTMGRLTLGGQDYDGVIINKSSGNFAFSSYNRVSDAYGFTGIYDGSGNVILSDDAVAEEGIARPWLTHTLVNTSELASPPAARSTTSTSDQAVQSTITYIQHPKLVLWAYIVINTGGDTAEFKVKDVTNGTTLYSQTVSASGYINPTFVIPGGFGDTHQLDFTIRRASGTGTVGVTVITVHGRQS